VANNNGIPFDKFLEGRALIHRWNREVVRNTLSDFVGSEVFVQVVDEKPTNLMIYDDDSYEKIFNIYGRDHGWPTLPELKRHGNFIDWE